MPRGFGCDRCDRPAAWRVTFTEKARYSHPVRFPIFRCKVHAYHLKNLKHWYVNLERLAGDTK